MDELSSAVYGDPPADLADLPPGARQVSPLRPGATPLESLGEASLDRFVMLAPPGTIERRYTLAVALRTLKPGASLVALAPKDKGGSRLGKELRELGCAVDEDSKRHHRICSAPRPAELGPAVDEALAEGAPRLLEETGLWTQPGVFSWNRVDAGSALLVEKLPPLAGRGADLGAGLGFLTRAVLAASRTVKHMDLVELDHRAYVLSERNVNASRTTRHWADVRTATFSFRELDFVVTNPPFHDGGQEDQSLGLAFLRRAAELLRPGGVCWLVANRHLPYEALLRESFARVSSVAETGGFKVYKAER